MAGTLKQLDAERWQLRVYLGRDSDGRVLQVNRNFTGGKRAAQKALAKLVLEVGSGQVAKHPLSVAELLDRWLADRKPRLTASSYKEYHRSVEKDLKPALGHVRLDKLTAQHLDNFYTAQLSKGLSPSTVHKQHAHLSGAAAWRSSGA